MKEKVEYLTNIPTYDLGEIILRPIKETDASDMYEYGSDKNVTKWLSWSYDKIEDAKSSVQSVFLSRPSKGIPLAHAIVHKESNKMIGTCDFHSVNFDQKSGEIGYCLNANYWGKGYMTKACQKMIEFGFDYLKLEIIEIMHHPKNVGSQKVIERTGFNRKGSKFNKMHQMEIPYYTLKKAEYKTKQ